MSASTAVAAVQYVHGKIYSNALKASLNYSQPLPPEHGRILTKNDVTVRLQDGQLCFITVLQRPHDPLDCAWTFTRVAALPLPPNSSSDWTMGDYSVTEPRQRAAPATLVPHESLPQAPKRGRGRPPKAKPDEDTIDQTIRSSSTESPPMQRPARKAAIAGLKRTRPDDNGGEDDDEEGDKTHVAEPISKRRRFSASQTTPPAQLRALIPLEQIQRIYGVNVLDGSIRVSILEGGTVVKRTTRSWRAFYDVSTGKMESKLLEFLQDSANSAHAKILAQVLAEQFGRDAANKLRETLTVHDAEIVDV